MLHRGRGTSEAIARVRLQQLSAQGRGRTSKTHAASTTGAKAAEKTPVWDLRGLPLGRSESQGTGRKELFEKAKEHSSVLDIDDTPRSRVECRRAQGPQEQRLSLSPSSRKCVAEPSEPCCTFRDGLAQSHMD